MKLYCTNLGCVIEYENVFYSAGDVSWDALIIHEDLEDYLAVRLSINCAMY